MVGFRGISKGSLAVFLLSLGGCASLPESGPSSQEIRAQSSETVPYSLVKLDQHAIAVLSATEPQGLAGTFTDRHGPSAIRIGIGDVVSVTIFEAAAGGLFVPAEAGVRPGNFVTIPDQVVDNNGRITMPYAGQVVAAGHTTVEVQNSIVEKIKNRAIEPQVVVTIAQQRTSLVSVLGEVNQPTRFAAAYSGAGDRISDAITRAGGIKGQGYESWIIVERENHRGAVPFENLIMNPANNIYVQPGDRIYVYREQQKFLAFGASGQQGEFNFDAWRINLAEGVAKAGGQLDSQADPGSVFLYRREPRDVASKLGVDVAKFQGPSVPVIFQVSFRDPGGYFLATKLMMRNQDIIFVANAASVEVVKFLNLINAGVGTASNVVNGASNGYVLRGYISGTGNNVVTTVGTTTTPTSIVPTGGGTGGTAGTGGAVGTGGTAATGG